MSLKIKNQRHKVMTLLPVFPSSLQIVLRRLRTQATTTQPTSRQEETLLLEECSTKKNEAVRGTFAMNLTEGEGLNEDRYSWTKKKPEITSL